MQYILVVDKQPRSNPSTEKREYKINIEELRAKGDIYDSLIIKMDKAHVLRRLTLSKYHVLKVLPEPIKEPLEDITIELFDGDNYIYLVDMIGNIFYAEYLNKNDFNDIFATRKEMNGAIEVSSREIEIGVNEKFTNYSTTKETQAMIDIKANEIREEVSNTYATQEELVQEKSERVQTATQISEEISKKVDEATITGAYLILKINGDTSEAKLNADKIELSANDILNLIAGNAINLTAKNMTIASTNFNVDKNGNMTCNNANVTGKVTATSGKIAGFTVNNNTLKAQAVGMCGVDGEEWAFWSGSATGANAPFRVGHSGEVYMSNVAITGGSVNLISDRGYSSINALGSDDSLASIMSRYIFISEPGTSYLPAQIDMHVYEEDNGDPGIDLIARNIANSTSIKASGIETPKLTAFETLYDNTSGTTGTVTLSENVANFRFVEIFYKGSDGYINCVRVYSPNGKKVWLSNGYIGTDNISGNMKYKVVSISGTTITTNNYILQSFGSEYKVAENSIYILRVDGYR